MHIVDEQIKAPIPFRLEYHKWLHRADTSWQPIDNAAFSLNPSLLSKDAFHVMEYQAFKLRIFFNEENVVELLIDDTIVKNFNKSGQEYELGNQDDFRWPPGQYVVVIMFNEREYFLSFAVVARNMDEQALYSMRELINSMVSGLAIDIKRQHVYATIAPMKNNHLTNSMVVKYELFKLNLPYMLANCIEIIKNPLQSLEKKYGERKVSKYADSRSMRWLSSAKGSARAGSVSQPQVVFEKKAESVIAKKENYWLYYILQDLRFELGTLESAFSMVLHGIKMKSVEKEAQYDLSSTKMHRLKEDYPEYLLKIYEKQVVGEHKRLDKEVNDLQSRYHENKKRHDELRQWLARISDMQRDLLSLLHPPIPVVVTPTLQILKNHHYRAVYSCHGKVMKNSLSTHLHSGKGQQYYKSSDKLYEYYVWIQLITIFQELGYVWTEGWLQDVEGMYCQQDLEDDTCVVLEDEQYLVHATFNQRLSLRPTEARSFYSTANITPDIRVDFFNKHTYEFMKSFIIEVKYRPFHYLYDLIYDNSVMQQIKRYRQTIEYITPEMSEPNSDPIFDIFIVYPKDVREKNVVRTEQWWYCYCQLSPGSKDQGTFGYQEFKTEIKQWISKRIKRDTNCDL